MQKDMMMMMMMMMMGIKLITELWNLLPLKRSVLEKLCVAFDNIFFYSFTNHDVLVAV